MAARALVRLHDILPEIDGIKRIAANRIDNRRLWDVAQNHIDPVENAVREMLAGD